MAAAAEALAEAGALVLLLIFFVLLALARTIQWWLRPLVNALGSVPAIGWLVSGLITSTENAVINALEAGYKGSERIVSYLWQALVWDFTELGSLLEKLGQTTYNALYHLYHVATHDVAKAFLTPVLTRLSAVEQVAANEVMQEAIDILGVEAEITSRINHTISSLEAQGIGSFQQIGRDVHSIVNTAKADILSTVESDVRSIRSDLSALKGEETAAIAAVGTAAGRAAAEAKAAATTAAQATAQAAVAVAEAGAAVAGQIPSIPLPSIAPPVDTSSLVALGASLAGLGALVSTVVTEAGLNNPECRSKVKQVCSTNTSAWGNLLAGLVAVAAIPSLSELAAVARDGVGLIGDTISAVR